MLKLPSRTMVALLACVAAPVVQAQSFTYVVSGMVLPCAPGDSVLMELTFNTEPPYDTLVAVDAGTCVFSASLEIYDEYASVTVSIPCNGTIAMGVVSTQFNYPDYVLAHDSLILDCGVTYDCAGVPLGPNVPGTPCEDGNPTTENELWQTDCQCAGDTTLQYDCLNIFGGPNLPGTPCNDLDSLNTNDVWTAACQCQGEPFAYDCNGVPSGPDMPGTYCDDGNPLTIGDVWTTSCACVGYSPSPCAINFQVVQAMAYDSVSSTSTPVPGTLWVSTQGNGAWPFQYFWAFGDGTTSTDPYPTHTYAGNGPYNLCVTLTDAIGCNTTLCDSISVDEDGMIVNLGLGPGGHGSLLHQRSGLTIQVVNALPTSVGTVAAETDISIRPNPATDELYVRMPRSGAAPIMVRIVDINGRTARTWNMPATGSPGTMALQIHALMPGLYHLQVNMGGRTWTKSFVKAE